MTTTATHTPPPDYQPETFQLGDYTLEIRPGPVGYTYEVRHFGRYIIESGFRHTHNDALKSGIRAVERTGKVWGWNRW